MAATASYKVLGSLEQTVMEYFWKHGPSNTVTVQRYLNRHISTVSTILQRLTKKGLLIQEGPQRNCEGYTYTPRVTKEELIILAFERLLWDFKATPTERQKVFEAFLLE